MWEIMGRWHLVYNLEMIPSAFATMIYQKSETLGGFLDVFSLCLGLRLNFLRVLCGIGIQELEVSQMADCLGCRVENLPLCYLGLPLGANPGRLKTWHPVVDRVEKSLAKWKQRFLSFGGRP